MTIEELGKNTKNKYPQYAGLSDAEVGNKVLQKYPQYQAQITKPQTAASWASAIPGLKQVQDFGVGVGSAIGNAGLGLGQTALRFGAGVGDLMNKVAPGSVDTSLARGAIDTLEKGKNAIFNTPFEGNKQTYSGKAGTFVGNMAPYMAGGAPVQASKLVFGNLLKRTATALPFAGIDATIAAGQSGGDWKTAAGTGAASLVGNTILPGAGSPIAQKILTGTATGYAGDVGMGLAGQRGEDRTGLGALIPGFGTALGTGLGTLSAIPQIRQSWNVQGDQKTFNNRLNELTNLQQSNSRINRLFETADRSGVDVKKALSDSDLLAGAVTKEGRINTRSPGMAVDKLDDMLAPFESKVGEALRAENKSVPVSSVRDYLYKTIDDAGLLADVRTTARNRVDAMIGGLNNVVDANGNIPLSVVHDLKVQTNNLNAKSFQNPEANAVGKNIGRGLKEFVENNTQAIDVKGYNQDLRRFYALRDALYGMHGATVRGGRMGKYFSQTIGAVAGNAIGGPVGAIVGAGVGGALRGAQLQSTFGKGGTPIAPTARMQQVAEQVGQSNNLGSRNTTQSTTAIPINNVKPTSKLRTPAQSTPLSPATRQGVSSPKSTAQKVLDAIRPGDTPGKEGGYVINPFTKKKISAIDEATKRELLSLQEGLRAGKAGGEFEKMLQRFADKYGIPMDASKQKQIAYITKLLDKTDTMSALPGTYTRR